MIGRGALADPSLPLRLAAELGLSPQPPLQDEPLGEGESWPALLREFALFSGEGGRTLPRLKQWLAMANRHGSYHAFERVKRAESVEALLVGLVGG